MATANPRELANQFLAALAANDAGALEQLLAEGAGLRVWGSESWEGYRARRRVITRLMEERARWSDAAFDTFSVVVEGERTALEFRVHVTDGLSFVEHNRAAFLTLKDDAIETINLYCARPKRTAPRKGWIAPATLTEGELNQLLEAQQYGFDLREGGPPDARSLATPSGWQWGSDLAHPGSNGVGGARWTAEEADAKIQELIEFHRARNIGFQWFVGPFDTPADLRARLERHGLVLAGSHGVMARLGLDQLDDIPINPRVEIEIVDGSNPESMEAALHVTATGFHMPPEQVEQWRAWWLERLQKRELREIEFTYLARLEGKPVAYGRLMLRGGRAHLAGAATLPEYRGRKIYSTLLRRRLDDARARGYQLATVGAGPMSRRVVERYGFKEFARAYVYGWMPVIDLDVIRALAPNE